MDLQRLPTALRERVEALGTGFIGGLVLALVQHAIDLASDVGDAAAVLESHLDVMELHLQAARAIAEELRAEEGARGR